MPPMIPANSPANNGAPDASAMPRQSGSATRNTTTLAVRSRGRVEDDNPVTVGLDWFSIRFVMTKANAITRNICRQLVIAYFMSLSPVKPANLGGVIYELTSWNEAQMAKAAKKKTNKPGHPASSSVGSTHRWTFLTNHAHVLAVLHLDPQLVLRQVAAEVGITERAVQRIILDLEEGGFIEREKVGRRNQYRILTRQSLRHPIEAHRKIGDLLKLIAK
jgi:predicted transcriptional regulator